MWGIHRWPVNSSHKRPVTRKMLPFDDVIICICSQGVFLFCDILPTCICWKWHLLKNFKHAIHFVDVLPLLHVLYHIFISARVLHITRHSAVAHYIRYLITCIKSHIRLNDTAYPCRRHHDIESVCPGSIVAMPADWIDDLHLRI